MEPKRDAQTEWLVKSYESVIYKAREAGGFPVESESGVLALEIPPLSEQARVVRWREQLPPGHNAPTGVLDWIE